MVILTHKMSESIPPRGQASPPLLAAIDLGTNSCRLLIARPHRGRLQIVDSFSRIVRLGENLPQTGVLGQAAIDRTIEALKICAGKIATHQVQWIRAVATEACRRASNGQALAELVLRETGIRLDIVSAAEEASLAARGCGPLIGRRAQGALVFDIGGGSTEVIWLKKKAGADFEIVHFASVPAGVITLGDSMPGAGFDALKAAMLKKFTAVRAEMDRIAPFDTAHYHLLGTSGTVTTLAGIALKLPRYVRARVDGSWHDSAAMDHIVDRLVHMDRAARAKIGCIGEERTDLVIPGCAIYAAIRTIWPCTRLRVADRGLREGILRDLLKESQT